MRERRGGVFADVASVRVVRVQESVDDPQAGRPFPGGDKTARGSVKIFTTHREITRTKEGVASIANERSKTLLTMTASTVLGPGVIRRSEEADTTTRTAPRRSDHFRKSSEIAQGVLFKECNSLAAMIARCGRRAQIDAG